MCRLLAIHNRSGAPEAALFYKAKDSLVALSREHKDGWGCGVHENGRPRVVCSVHPAFADDDFLRLKPVGGSPTVFLHIRKATAGNNNRCNCHPFVCGPWMFMHNGNVYNFGKRRREFLQLLSPAWRARIRGTTDSELCFYLFLAELQKRGVPGTSVIQAHTAVAALAEVTRAVHALSSGIPGTDDETTLNFMAADGNIFLASRFGETLFYRGTGPGSVDGPEPGRTVEELVVASETMGHGDGWIIVPERSIVSVDSDARLEIAAI